MSLMIKHTVQSGVDAMFSSTAKWYGLETGDFAPERELKLDAIKASLEILLLDYVIQNTGSKS